LGASYYTSFTKYFNGMIDEFRFSNKVRTKKEIEDHYHASAPFAADTHTIGLWHFDEGSGKVMKNQMGKSGTLYGGVKYVSGKFGTALSLDGVNDRGDFNLKYSEIPEHNLTFEFWVKGDAFTKASTLIQPYGMYNSDIWLKSETVTETKEIEQVFVIRVTDDPADNLINEIVLSNNSVLENMPMGTVVGKFSGGGAANPEFALVEGKDSGGNKYFTLGKDGTLRTAVILDYNRTKSLNIRVRYTEGPMKMEKSFTINVSENAIVPPPPPPDPTDYEKKYNEALARLETLRAMEKKADADIAQRRARLAKLDGELSAADKSLQEADVSLAVCEKECNGLAADLRAIDGAIGVEDAKIYGLNGKIVASEKQFIDLENDKSKLEEDLAEAERKGSVPHTPGWHFIDGKGWLWTSPDYYPLVYSEQVDGWMYYESGSQAPWLYFDYNTESWQEWSAN
jgi:hypothetical protein